MQNKIRRADMHVHSNSSLQGGILLADIISQSSKKRLTDVAITDTVDFSTQPMNEVVNRIKERNDRIDMANLKGLNIIKGIEISEPYIYDQELSQLIEKVSLDYILGSVHNVLGMPLVKMAHDKNTYNAYFKSLLSMVTYADIDAVAHLDYLKQYVIKGMYDTKIIEEILSTMIGRNIVLEINTSGYRKVNELFPSDDILEIYARLGGKNVVIGSGAHQTEELYQSIEESQNQIKDYGFHECVLKKRKINRLN